MEKESRLVFALNPQYVDLAVMFLFLCVGGNPLFSGKLISYTVYLIIAALCFWQYRPRITVQFLCWAAIFVALFALQFIFLDRVSIPADINFLVMLSMAWLVASSLGTRFRFTYIRVMTFLCAFSLAMFLPNLLGISIGLPIGHSKTLLIYHIVLDNKLMRNCGMFWEPGAFQGYIMLVPLLYIDRLKDLWNRNRIPCIILILTLLSTQSTTGYVVFFCFFLGYFAITVNNKLFLVAIMVILLAAGAFVFSTFDFLGQKISEQYQEAILIMESFGDTMSWSRMGSMLIDFENLKRHFIVGNGFLMESKYGNVGEFMTGAGNGFSGAANILGVPVLLAVLYGFSIPFKGIKPLLRVLYVVIIVLILNGEYFLNYSFFWSLLFVVIPKLIQNEECSSTDDGSQP